MVQLFYLHNIDSDKREFILNEHYTLTKKVQALNVRKMTLSQIAVYNMMAE